MKKLRKIVPAFVLLLVAMSMLGTATFAWFSMNNKVSITGMEVKTKVTSNLYIASSAVDAAAPAGDSSWQSAYKQSLSETTLEPVSTVDGLNFFYADSKNVKNTGAVNDGVNYIEYDPNDTDDFNTNYGTTGAVGYVDYTFQLKAVNPDTNAQYINLSTLNLGYRGTDALTGINAFRVAIFYTKAEDEVFEQTALEDFEEVVLMGNASANYLIDDQAVSAVNELDDVVLDSFDPITVAGQETAYYKFNVRLWIEGEDEKCNNTTFATLNQNWELDLGFSLVDTSGTAKEYITNSVYRIVARVLADTTGSTIAAGGGVTEGTYYLVDGLTFDGVQVYADNSNLEDATKFVTAELKGAPEALTGVADVTSKIQVIKNANI